MQIHLNDLLMRQTHEFRCSSVAGRTSRVPLVPERNSCFSLIQNGHPHLPGSAKKCEVTWCYNHQEDLTLFGSTPITGHNKLTGRPVGGTSSYRRNVLIIRQQPVGDANGTHVQSTLERVGRPAVSTCRSSESATPVACFSPLQPVWLRRRQCVQRWRSPVVPARMALCSRMALSIAAAMRTGSGKP